MIIIVGYSLQLIKKKSKTHILSKRFFGFWFFRDLLMIVKFIENENLGYTIEHPVTPIVPEIIFCYTKTTSFEKSI